MIAIGILAVCQLTFLPGSLALRLLSHVEKPRRTLGLIPALAYSFGLSLILNYCLVFALTALHLYTRPVISVLVGLELAAWVWAFRAVLFSSLGQSAARIRSRAGQWISTFVPDTVGADEGRTIAELLSALTTIVFAGLALSAILWIGSVFLANLGGVFNSWDAIMSWNRWAVEWSQNHLPTETAQYPQLLPTNWSLTYVLTGSSQIQFFAKAVMPLFLLFTFLLLFDLGLDYRASGFFLAITLTQLMTKKYTGEFITEGYADIPLAFMGLLAVYPLLKKYERLPLQAVLLGLILAAGSAVTKQPGMWVLAVYPFLAFAILRGEAPALELRRDWKKIAAALALAGLIAGPWYVYKQFAIQAGTDTSNVETLVVGMHAGAGLLERFLNAMKELDKYALLLALLVPALVWLPRRIRWTVLLVAFPWALLWAFLFSYTPRNFALAVPFVALGAGVAIGRVLDLLYGLVGKIRLNRAPVLAFVILAAAALGALAFFVPEQALADRQTQLQKQVFSPQLNQKLYDYIASHDGQNARILTNYPVAYLPGLEENQISFWYKDFATYESLREGKGFDYLLVPFYSSADITADIDQRLQSGEYELVFEDNHYLAYRFIRVR